ncbi:MAG: betaine/proline/choline family ABC transporter ATP-binding protein [Granulosicoccus sp.]|nr:betaine/proline/choline family ABC transporter ATP-binding protein [Granulosicoccus sp.]
MSQNKLICQDVWKLYGRGASRLFRDHAGAPSLDSILSAGLTPAVRAANLEIRVGEIFVIMGLSGSGKSTLVRCMSRLIEPTHGALLFEGRDLRSMSSREMISLRRHKLGMVFQHFALLPHLSVMQNVAFPLAVQGMDRQQREQRAADVIKLVGLDGREQYLPAQLSGGQQQRVGIARSLAVEPELWFLDEPFSALDPLIRREMQDEFLRLQASLQKTIVFITHDFDEAIRLADRIAIMKDGAIIQVATPEELVKRPADDYVREFTRYIPREKVTTIASIMSAVADAEGTSGASLPGVAVNTNGLFVDASSKVADVARAIIESEQPVPVLNDRQQLVGHVHRQQVLDLLIEGLPE